MRFIGRRARGFPAQHPPGFTRAIPPVGAIQVGLWPVSAAAAGTDILALPRWLSHQIPAGKVWEWALTPIPHPGSPHATGLTANTSDQPKVWPCFTGLCPCCCQGHISDWRHLLLLWKKGWLHLFYPSKCYLTYSWDAHGWDRRLCMQLESPRVKPSPAHRCKTCLCSADLKHRINQPEHTICFLLLVNIRSNPHCQLSYRHRHRLKHTFLMRDFPKLFQRWIYSPNPRTCFTICPRAFTDALNLKAYRKLLILKNLLLCVLN